MGRRLFNFISLVSILLFVATAAIWTRSQWRWDHQFHDVGRWSIGLNSCEGVTEADAGPADTLLSYESLRSGLYPPCYAEDIPSGVMCSNRLGQFVYSNDHPWYRQSLRIEKLADTRWQDMRSSPNGLVFGSSVSRWRVTIADWMILVVTALAPTIWTFRHWHARRTAAAGMCRQCGYDLRATPERCPECGLIMPL
jgi:hypothetical protein